MHRDTNSLYGEESAEARVAPGHLAFALEHAGPVVHDSAAATGDYVEALLRANRRCTGSDLNEGYVAAAVDRGLPVVHRDAAALGLPDNSIDTVLLFEILEHVPDRDARLRILTESRRVARRNVLITTPNSTDLDLLWRCGLTYEHMLDRDHSVFFSEAMLRDELSAVFERFSLDAREEIDSRILAEILPGPAQRLLHLVWRVRPHRPRLYYRFYAVAAAD